MHAAQFQLFLYVQNLNTQSPGYGDMLWFGVPIFDNRRPSKEETYQRDGGKPDASGKFIYSLPSKACQPEGQTFFKNGIIAADQDARWTTIRINAAPWMVYAYKLARQNGYLVNGAGYYLQGVPIDPTTGNPSGSAPQILQFGSDFLLTGLTGYKEPWSNLDNFIAKLEATCTQFDRTATRTALVFTSKNHRDDAYVLDAFNWQANQDLMCPAYFYAGPVGQTGMIGKMPVPHKPHRQDAGFAAGGEESFT